MYLSQKRNTKSTEKVDLTTVAGKYSVPDIYKDDPYTRNILQAFRSDTVVDFLLKANQYLDNSDAVPYYKYILRSFLHEFLYDNGEAVYQEVVQTYGVSEVPVWLWKTLLKASNWRVQSSVLRDVPTEVFELLIAGDFWNEVRFGFLSQAIGVIRTRDDYWGGLSAELIRELLFPNEPRGR